MEFWERRGAAIYTEAVWEHEESKLIAELHPANTDLVQAVVDRHNEAVKDAYSSGTDTALD